MQAGSSGRVRSFAAVLAAALLLPCAAQAAGLAITPGGIATDYAGAITIDVTGLTGGSTVVVECFVDLDADGVIDAGEPLAQSFPVTDGVLPTIGGVRATRVPGDEDGAEDGKIKAVLQYPQLVESMRAAASYLYRVSGGMPPITPVVTPYVVSAAAHAQHVEGTVTSGGAVPGAFVFLLSDNSDGPVAAGVSDASGDFTLPAPPGTYSLAATKANFVLGDPPQVMLGLNATVMQDVALIAATRTITGTLTDSATGLGIPGVQLFVSDAPDPDHGDGSPFTLSFTDAMGAISIPVVSGATWRIEGADGASSLGGWLQPAAKPAINTTGGSVAGVAIVWLRGTALIHGTVTGTGGAPIPGVPVYVEGSTHRSFGMTNAMGQYSCAASAGSFSVSLDSDALQALGYFAMSHQVQLVAGQAVQEDFALQAADAHIQGQISEFGGDPLVGVSVVACPPMGGGGCTSTTSQGDGSYDLLVPGGDWSVSGSGDELAALGFVGPQVPATVAAEGMVTGIDVVVRPVTAQVMGTVKDSLGTAVNDIFVYGSRMLGGLNYGASAQTVADGSYSLGLFNGTWMTFLECQTLTERGFVCPSNQQVVVSGADQTLNWVLDGLVCTGDCNADGTVSDAELNTLVDIALGITNLGNCGIGDSNADEAITVRDLVAALVRKIGGCQPS